MFYGPFHIEVSKVAELIDLDSLPLAEKEVLSYGIHYDPATHDVFRFFVMPVFQMTEAGHAGCPELVPKNEKSQLLPC